MTHQYQPGSVISDTLPNFGILSYLLKNYSQMLPSIRKENQVLIRLKKKMWKLLPVYWLVRLSDQSIDCFSMPKNSIRALNSSPNYTHIISISDSWLEKIKVFLTFQKYRKLKRYWVLGISFFFFYASITYISFICSIIK